MFQDYIMFFSVVRELNCYIILQWTAEKLQRTKGWKPLIVMTQKPIVGELRFEKMELLQNKFNLYMFKKQQSLQIFTFYFLWSFKIQNIQQLIYFKNC